MDNNTKQSGQGNVQTEETDIRLKTPAVLGLDKPYGQAMALVNRILQPQSTHDAANALFELLELTAKGDHSKRFLIVFVAQTQAMLWRDDWEDGFRYFLSLVKKQEKRLARQAKRKGGTR